MTTAVVSLPLPQPHEHVVGVDNPAEARKRRREILASQRLATATPDASLSVSAAVNPMVPVSSTEVNAANKRRRVSAFDSELPSIVSPTAPPKVITTSIGNTKKPQMKYDPDVPMTKEEAAAWRREQRRKRNRESAAASRQRQRDRIVELEAELEEWKASFDTVMKKIQVLEGEAPISDCSDLEGEEEVNPEGSFVHFPEALVEEVFRDTTFLISPSQSPRSVSPASSPADYSQDTKVVSSVSTNQVSSSASISSSDDEEDSVEPKPSKMISRPAQSRIIHPVLS